MNSFISAIILGAGLVVGAGLMLLLLQALGVRLPLPC